MKSDNEDEEEAFDISSLDLGLRQEISLTKSENTRLQEAMSSLHDKYNTMSSEVQNKCAFSSFLSLLCITILDCF